MKSWQELTRDISSMRTTISQWQAKCKAQTVEIARLVQKLERLTEETIRRRRLLQSAMDSLRVHEPNHPVIRDIQEEIAWSIQIERSPKDKAA